MTNEIAILHQELSELKQLVGKDKASRLNDSLFSKELAPHYMSLASQLAKSSMVPKSYQGKPQDLFVAMAMGYQMGLSVEQSIQDIAVINGKPAIYGDAMLGLCIVHPEFVDITEEKIIKDGATFGYRCTVRRKGMEEESSEFTLDMAKKAGLLGKVGPWTQYPERMLQMRARSYALRNKFPDVLKGVKSREEVEDYIEAEFKVVDNKGSRTEFLKQDILEREQSSEAAVEEEVQTSVETGLPRIAEIHRLIDEKGVTEERVYKALAYYEVDSIESLSDEQAEDMIQNLLKL